jgi:hypothetical protein
MGKRGPKQGQCSICQSPDRNRIEQAVVSGVSANSVAKRYGCTKWSLYRHFAKNHVTPEQKANYLAAVPLTELAATAAEAEMSTLNYYRYILNVLFRQFQFAEASGDPSTLINSVRVMLETLRDKAKLTGEIRNFSGNSVTITNNTVFLESPEYAQLQSMLIRVLTPFPDALKAVVAGFDSLQEATEQDRPSPPLLELQGEPS